jgi:cyclohexadieny/prephenate dehydrogenase / 3-phosphoshikimate 1-carboxyvinyltransferase
MSNQNNINYLAESGQPLKGTFRVPGDKSISHRSIILGSLSTGVTQITGFLEGDDSLATMRAFQDMGVKIELSDVNGVKTVTIHGVGLYGLKASSKPIDLGNSGTAIRLIAGILSGQSFDSKLIGDESLSKRPMQRIIDPLSQMGAVVESSPGGLLPLNIKGGQSLSSIEYESPIASAQVKSCVLLAALYAEGVTKVTEPVLSRDHTERMLTSLQYPISSNDRVVEITGKNELIAKNIDIPADISSAAFFMVAASIIPGSEIVIQHVGINSTRDGVIQILRGMGANITLVNQKNVGGECVADIHVKSASLKGVVIPEPLVASAIDEFPVLFVAATQADGETVLTGAKELRVKESDRILAMSDGFSSLGVACEVLEDGIKIKGKQTINGGVVDSLGDHRIAMSFSIAAQIAQGPIKVLNCANVATSFPNFLDISNQLGMQVKRIND